MKPLKGSLKKLWQNSTLLSTYWHKTCYKENRLTLTIKFYKNGKAVSV